MTGGKYYRQIVAEVRARGNFFKATQPDGFSFRDWPKKQYVVGETTVASCFSKKLCWARLLHVDKSLSKTLADGMWPARLFEVRGRIVAGFTAEHQHKGGAKRLYVVRELPAWVALGPNGRIVAAFIAALPTLNVAAWRAARDAAWNAARASAWNADRRAAWRAARDAAWASAWGAARDAAWRAALALVVADLITPEHLATLYAPFEKALPLADLRKRAIAAYPIGKLN